MNFPSNSLVDCHCHFDQLTEEEQARWAENSEVSVVGVGVGLESSKKLISLAKQYYPKLRVCLGVHPESSLYFDEDEVSSVCSLIRAHAGDRLLLKSSLSQEKIVLPEQAASTPLHVVGIGEVGLPFFNFRKVDVSTRQQKLAAALLVLEKFVALGAELDLPLNLHCVADTAEPALNLLRRYNIRRALFHWFQGSAKAVEEISRLGYNISVSPDLISNQTYRSFLRSVPLDLLCFESDGPWKYSGERGTPDFVPQVAQVLADLHECSLDVVCATARRNSQRLWR